MKFLQLRIDCGERTCSPEPGKFCRFLRTRKFGTVYFCSIWHDMDDKGRPVPLEEEDGWLMRRSACLDNERNGTI